MRAPQDVAPLRQVVCESPFETFREVAVPFMVKSRSLQVIVPRLKSLGKVTETVLDAVVPLREPSLAIVFCTVKVIAWLEVADVPALFKVSDRLVT